MAREPALEAAKSVCGEPSFQSTSTVHGPSLASLNEPRLNDLERPSVAVWLEGAVNVGGVPAARPPLATSPTRRKLLLNELKAPWAAKSSTSAPTAFSK